MFQSEMDSFITNAIHRITFGAIVTIRLRESNLIGIRILTLITFSDATYFPIYTEKVDDTLIHLSLPY